MSQSAFSIYTEMLSEQKDQKLMISKPEESDEGEVFPKKLGS